MTKVLSMKKVAAALVLMCFPAVFCAAQKNRVVTCPRDGTSQSSTKLEADDPGGKDYNEISGLALSPTRLAPSGEPVLYGVNDSGGGKRLGIFDSGNGQRLLTLSLEAFEEKIHDWESMAIGSCGSTGQKKTCIYIADVGDNAARGGSPLGERSQRKGIPYQILKIREPILDNFEDGDEIPATDLSILPFDYKHPSSPSDYADCEAVFVDHVGWGGEVGDFYFVTKWGWGTDAAAMTRVFRIPASVWPSRMNGAMAPTYSPEAVSDAGAANLTTTWTSADMTLDGTVIALGDYWETILFLRCPGMSVAEALDTPYCHYWEHSFSSDARQYETFAWAPDGKKSLQMSECGSCSPPMTWTVMEYGDESTGIVCPDVHWTPVDESGYACRVVQDNSIKPDSWCDDREIVRPTGDSGTAKNTTTDVSAKPTLSPNIASTPAPSLPPTVVSTSGSDSLGNELPTSTSGSDTLVMGSLQHLSFLFMSCIFLI